MQEFFQKYSVALDERNAIEHIICHAKLVKKAYEKSKEKGRSAILELKTMIDDFIEDLDEV